MSKVAPGKISLILTLVSSLLVLLTTGTPTKHTLPPFAINQPSMLIIIIIIGLMIVTFCMSIFALIRKADRNDVRIGYITLISNLLAILVGTVDWYGHATFPLSFHRATLSLPGILLIAILISLIVSYAKKKLLKGNKQAT